MTVSDLVLGGMSAPDWDRLAGPHFYSSAAWLRFCSRKTGGRSTAVVGRVGGQAASAVPVLQLSAPPPPLYRWNDLLAQCALPTLAPSGLLVGPRQGYQTHVLSAPDADPAAGTAALVAALRDVEVDATTSGRPARVAMYVTTADALLLQAGGVTAPPVLIEADACFELPGGCWDGWLEGLARKRRDSVRRELRQFRSAGYVVEHLSLGDCYEELPALAAATQAKYGDVADPDFWLTLLRGHVAGMGAAARVSICRRPDGEAVGFCLYYVHAQTLYLRWVGFDYQRLSGSEYFNLAYYDHIARAAELGITRIHAGIKAPLAKTLRGAALQPLWLVDLEADSPLCARTGDVRRHNRQAYQALLDEVHPVTALGDADQWLAFS
jgi:predicted N-acyltransferase